MTNCAEYVRLQACVENTLATLAQLTTRQLELFRGGDFAGARGVDRQLELTVGEKERAIGSLRQHMSEHRCQGREPI